MKTTLHLIPELIGSSIYNLHNACKQVSHSKTYTMSILTSFERSGQTNVNNRRVQSHLIKVLSIYWGKFAQGPIQTLPTWDTT